MRIAESASRQASQAVAGQAQEILVLSSDDISRLAREADTVEAAIREVAPQLDAQPLWKRSLAGVQDVYMQTPDEIRSNLVGLACQGATGDISSADELWANVLERFQESTQSDAVQYYRSALGLWQDIYEASLSSEPQVRATAVLACYTVENVG